MNIVLIYTPVSFRRTGSAEDMIAQLAAAYDRDIKATCMTDSSFKLFTKLGFEQIGVSKNNTPVVKRIRKN